MDIEILSLKSKEILPYREVLFRLRVDVFKEFPYLWEGTIEDERNSVYTKAFLNSEDAIMIVAKDKRTNNVIGLSTGNTFKNELPLLQDIFLQKGINTADYFYFRESMILPEYRQQGIGKLFFQERERLARQHSEIKYLTFFGVERSDNHPRKPINHRFPYQLWSSQGFIKRADISHEFEWKQVGEQEKTKNTIVFWVKKIQA